MAKFRKRIMKMIEWGMLAAKISLATAMLALPALPAHAEDEDSQDFWARSEQRLKNSSMHWFGGSRTAGAIRSVDHGRLPYAGSERQRSGPLGGQSQGRVCDTQRREFGGHVCILAIR